MPRKTSNRIPWQMQNQRRWLARVTHIDQKCSRYQHLGVALPSDPHRFRGCVLTCGFLMSTAFLKAWHISRNLLVIPEGQSEYKSSCQRDSAWAGGSKGQASKGQPGEGHHLRAGRVSSNLR